MANRKATWLAPTSRMCTLMLACDGNVLKAHMDICGPCEAARKKRAVKEIKLRGEHHMAYEDSRTKTH